MAEMTEKKRWKLTPYQRIVRAAKAGRGVRLTFDECSKMGVMDDAIVTRAELDNKEQVTGETERW